MYLLTWLYVPCIHFIPSFTLTLVLLIPASPAHASNPTHASRTANPESPLPPPPTRPHTRSSRGPFTPDFVKKGGGRNGYDPFVTKIRKSSVVVSCPGLLSSRCIPERILRELGV